MCNLIKLGSLVLTLLTFSTVAKTPLDWWNVYDYSQVSAQVVSRDNDAPLLRGRAVNLDLGSQKISAFYDVGSMNLRYVTLGSIQFKGTPWDGSHGGNSLIGGDIFLSSQASLAWTETSDWQDPRDFNYAPLPNELIEFKGTYRFNQQAIFHYTVGKQATHIFEMPQTIKFDEDIVFVRHFKVGPTNTPLKLKVIDQPNIQVGIDLFVHSSEYLVTENEEGLSYVEIPSSNTSQEFYITYAKTQVAPVIPPQDLASKIKGGSVRWPKTVTLSGELNTNESDSFVVDQIPLPMDNPYQSKIRFAGFDFFADGKRAAFATWNGDVWLASGLDKDLKNVTWKRYAAGINEALGLRIVDGLIYVTGKDQITRLHDFNNDGEADYYENFNNDIKITANFHEFTFGLQTDDNGNFYFSKAAPVKRGGRGFDVTHDNHGIVMKVSKDGKKSKVVLSGLRAGGGLSVSPDGSIITTGENEGTYVQACKVNYAKPGDFMGVIHPGNGRTLNQGHTKPLCYLPMQADNSGGGQVWVPEGAWGDLSGSLIHLSYGQSTAYTVIKEGNKKQVQGGVIAFPFKLMSSAMRARFNPANHNEMYIVGFKGWQTNASLLSAINRITYKNKDFLRVKEIKTTTKGVYLTFNQTLNPTSAIDLNNYNIERWNYVYSKQYGSAHFATDTPKNILDKYRNTESKTAGRIGIASNRSGENVYVTAAKLLPDNKTVFLKVFDMKPVDQMKIDYSVSSYSGKELKQTIYNTIYNLTADSQNLADSVTIAKLKEKEKLNRYDLGAKVQVQDQFGNKDTFKSRTLNLQIKQGDVVSPFLKEGLFNASYQGFIQVLEKDRVKFKAVGTGQFEFILNGRSLLNFNGNNQEVKSHSIPLNSGFHAYQINYKSTNNNPLFSMLWSGNKFPMGPVSPHSLRFLSDGAIQKSQSLRDKRNFVAEKRCFNCHSAKGELAMPELYQDSPSLDGIGSRLQESWLAQWIANPKKLNHNTNMPQLVNEQEAAHIAAYLANKSDTITNKSLEGDNVKGAGLFYDLGCIGCHTRPEQKSAIKGRTPLSYVAAKYQSKALQQYLLQPEANYKWTKMPNFNLSKQQAADLASYLRTASVVKQSPATSGDAKLGETLFVENRCGNCHGGQKKELIALDNLKEGCLSRTSDINLYMQNKPKWQMSAFLNAQLPSFERASSQEFTKRQIKALNCQACHNRDDQTSTWENHLESIKDLKVVHTDKGHLDQSRPSLTHAGDKLTHDTLNGYFSGSLSYNSREWLLAKMPSFPARAKLLTEGLTLEHGKFTPESALELDPGKVAEGEKLTNANGGFACVICHDVGEQKATAAFEVKGVNLKSSAKRLNREYFQRWMLNPVHIDPTTKMPKYFDDQGKSAMPVFNNDANKQIDAMHHYLHTLN